MNSIFADPHFADPEKGNFDMPAAAAGAIQFRPIDIKDVGVRER